MGNAIGLYIRLSSEDNKVGSYSIENQKRALHQYVDTRDWSAEMEVLEFVDNGYSGTNFERPAVQELLGLVQEGKICCIIVKDFTRFGRNSIEVGYFMEMVFPLYGVRFISINDEFDSAQLHGDTGGINVAFKYLISEFYSRDLSQKYTSAKYVKFRRGEYQSRICPYGYQKSADGRMEPDPETAENVKFLFELAAAGKNTTDIIKALYDRRVPTPGEYKASRGQCYHDISRAHGIWQRSTILDILHDERYTGTYIIGKRRRVEIGSNHEQMKEESEWIKIPDHHPALISKELFSQVQTAIRHVKSEKKKVAKYPLKGKVFCGCCFHGMQRIGKKTYRFACTHSKVNESAPCHGLTISEQDLENLLFEILNKQAQAILNLPDLSRAGRLDAELAKQTEYDRQIEGYLDQKRLLYERFLLKQISLEDYTSQKTTVDRELERLRELHTTLKARTMQMQIDEKTKSARRKLAQEVVETGKLTAGLVDSLIDKVYVYPGDQVEILWKMKDFCMEVE
ncbi:recombinase family protein [Acutalibacter muris]|uniref:recombinase family protein n=1 Tax=Acutalibacter muris TaxID=1796620 RepID=UPI00272C9EE3|nr:recombinase family protein [Acutalibacter muris]